MFNEVSPISMSKLHAQAHTIMQSRNVDECFNDSYKTHLHEKKKINKFGKLLSVSLDMTFSSVPIIQLDLILFCSSPFIQSAITRTSVARTAVTSGGSYAVAALKSKWWAPSGIIRATSVSDTL